MELILQTGLTHQQKAVDSIANVFDNTCINIPNQYFSNPEIYVENALYDNIQEVQKTNAIHSSLRSISKQTNPFHLDIKMETGTEIGRAHV